jgi:hypothetical protein
VKSIITFFSLCGKSLVIAYQWLAGSWRLSRIKKPIVTIFGGKYVVENSLQGKQAYDLAQQLVNKGFFLLTGGGPGAMEAVHCGALEGGIKGQNGDSLGIGVQGVDEAFKSLCSRHIFYVNYFFIRKWLLIHYSQAIVVLPGGYGTADELFEVINLVKLNRMPRIPIILVGKEYWYFMDQWIQKAAVAHGLVQEKDAHVYMIVDTNDEIMNAIRSYMVQR